MKPFLALVLLGVTVLGGCSEEQQAQQEQQPEASAPAAAVAEAPPATQAPEELAAFPLNGSETVVDSSLVEFDPAISTDGNGALKITAGEEGARVTLFEVPLENVENAMLSFTGGLRSEDLEGQAFLEIRCEFPDRGEFFGRAIEGAIRGTQDWAFPQAQFFLRPGDTPRVAKLGVVVTGKGTVWVDDARLAKHPLPQRHIEP